jgi:hypothetical protein
MEEDLKVLHLHKKPNKATWVTPQVFKKALFKNYYNVLEMGKLNLGKIHNIRWFIYTYIVVNSLLLTELRRLKTAKRK